MSKLSEIFNGWKNYTFPSVEMEVLAKERMEICVDCKDLRNNNTCRLCGCYMPAKVRSKKSRCGARKW